MAATPETPDDLDLDAAARATLYRTLAHAFQYPDEAFHEAAASGTLDSELRACVDRTALDVDPPGIETDDDYETLAARYNDIFELGYSEYTDRTDGSLDSQGPPVPLYESKYRDRSWNDVNLDLARAYDYYGLEIDQDERDNHDALYYELEFAAFLARREAAVDDDGAATARLDFHDRHLGHLAAGVADRLADEPGTDIYGPLGDLLESVVRADRNDLAERLEGNR